MDEVFVSPDWPFGDHLEADYEGVHIRSQAVKIFDSNADDFGNHPYVPHFILGHTHAPRRNAQISAWMFRREWSFDEYTNKGTAGRWEQLIWCSTVTHGEPDLHGWTRTLEGRLRRYTFQGGYAHYLRAA